MKMKQYGILAVGLLLVAIALWSLIPEGLGIKSQIQTLFQWIATALKVVIFVVLWILEVLVLLLGPWFLGWFGRSIVQTADEKLTPDQDLNGIQKFGLDVLFVVITFFLWILVPYLVTIVPPVSDFLVGPFIRGMIETGMVWWGVYGAIAYMLLPLVRGITKGY